MHKEQANRDCGEILDEDRDGRLSGSELDSVAERLLLLDTSDDRIVDQSELASLRDQLGGQSGQTPNYDRQSRRDAAIELRNSNDARDLEYLLSDLYAPRQELGPTSFAHRAKLFETLDSDGNDELDAAELAELITVQPHLELAIDFSATAEVDTETSRISLLHQAEEIERVLQNSGDRIVIETAGSRIVVSAHEVLEGIASSQSLTSSQISLMVHDRNDALFQCLDEDADGKLGEREVAHAANCIRKVDVNSDGQLDVGELSYSLTVAFIRGEAQSERSFYVPQIEPRVMADSHAPPWFSHADLNGDGDISRTEFLGSRNQFQALDTDRDEFISASEAAEFRQSSAVPDAF